MNESQGTKRLGDILLGLGAITRSQLEDALADQRRTGEFLGALLVRRGVVKPGTVLAALSQQFGIPHEALTPERVDWTVAKRFPVSVLSAGTCFPIRADLDSVTVAISNPLEAEALSGVERAAAPRRVRRVLVLEPELREVVRLHRQAVLRELQEGLGGHGRA
jgi:type IV pilus assembly protein PilB